MGDACLDTFHRMWVQQASSENAYFEIYWMIERCLGVKFPDLHQKTKGCVSDQKWRVLCSMVEAYLKGKPLAYLLGDVDFCKMRILVAEGVLIPRTDTEAMVEHLIQNIPQGAKVLELGVGSGAIGCALAKNRKDIQVLGIDNNHKALLLAEKNIKLHRLQNQFSVVYGNWCQDLSLGPFDWVVSNPPYIDYNDKNLCDKVKRYEPESALMSNDNGYADLKIIMKIAKELLSPRGGLTLEHGWKMQNAVCSLLDRDGYRVQQKGMDAQMKPRYVSAIVS